MLIADPARRRCTVLPLGLLAIALGLGAMTVLLLLGTASLREAWLPGVLAILVQGWFAYEVRHARREGETLEMRWLRGIERVPAAGAEVSIERGGGHRSPHFDVLLQPAGRPALRLARFEALGIGRTPRVARRIAAALDLPVHERSVGELEAQLGAAAEQRRGGWRWLLGIAAVGAVASVVMTMIAGETMATIIVRCPGGEVREGSATMLDGLKMTTDPGPHTFELHPGNEPPWTQRVELYAGRTTVIDCSARPRSTEVGEYDLKSSSR
jgi:hypothetical protein